jgi:uncharacterized protein
MERFFYSDEFSLTPADNSPGVLSGYFIKWNTLSHDRGGYRVVFRRGAFANLGTNDLIDIKAHRDHDYTTYLARTGNGTLTLMPDDIGVRFSVTLPDTNDGRDMAVLVARKDIAGMSFGYLPADYLWRNEDAGPIQEHTSGRLVEVSPVYDPGFPYTSLHLHSMGDPDQATLSSLNKFLAEPKIKEAKMRLWLAEKIAAAL